MKQLERVNERPYDIVIENSFDSLGSRLKDLAKPSQICIVTDTHVAPLFLEEIKHICGEVAHTVTHIFEAGEASKNINTIMEIYNTLITCNMDRQGLVVALGGGVVGDMAGFVAATFMRGIKYIQVPTTTVSHNDSSMGGKTGIDYLSHKNMIGAFYNPLLVYINTNTLKTLPQTELVGGLAEVIKHGIIKDAHLFDFLEEHVSEILSIDEAILEEMTYMSCKVKASVIEADLKEEGLRKILNFGHTIGHAIETLSKFTLSHGECVAYGSCMATYISARRGYLGDDVVERVLSLCKAYGLLKPFKGYSPEAVWEHMTYDKKRAFGKISFILLDEIGKTHIVTDVTEDEIKEAILFMEKRAN